MDSFARSVEITSAENARLFVLSPKRRRVEKSGMKIALALSIGLFAGLVAALCGVGGGVVMVPAFVLLLKMPQKIAVATSLAAIILTALATTAKNQLNGLIDWRIAVVSGLAGAFVGWFAADLLQKLRDVTLTRIFATVIIGFGVQMWMQSLNKQHLSEESKQEDSGKYNKN